MSTKCRSADCTVAQVKVLPLWNKMASSEKQNPHPVRNLEKKKCSKSAAAAKHLFPTLRKLQRKGLSSAETPINLKDEKALRDSQLHYFTDPPAVLLIQTQHSIQIRPSLAEMRFETKLGHLVDFKIGNSRIFFNLFLRIRQIAKQKVPSANKGWIAQLYAWKTIQEFGFCSPAPRVLQSWRVSFSVKV